MGQENIHGLTGYEYSQWKRGEYSDDFIHDIISPDYPQNDDPIQRFIEAPNFDPSDPRVKWLNEKNGAVEFVLKQRESEAETKKADEKKTVEVQTVAKTKEALAE